MGTKAKDALKALQKYRDYTERANEARVRAGWMTGGTQTQNKTYGTADRWDEKADAAFETVADYLRRQSDA